MTATSLNCTCSQAVGECVIMVAAALSYSSYVMYRYVSSFQCCCSSHTLRARQSERAEVRVCVSGMVRRRRQRADNAGCGVHAHRMRRGMLRRVLKSLRCSSSFSERYRAYSAPCGHAHVVARRRHRSPVMV